ncbi:MAG: lipoxygenase family protein [Calothrix sp. MO_167.B12]|nr:lipoxygenase family protein [Calothrix sp. MO_167.B12]
MNTPSPNTQKNFLPDIKLELARREYKYNYNLIPPVAMVDELPNGENFSTAWFRLLAEQLKDVFVNTLITNRGNIGSMRVHDDVTKFILEVILKGAIPFQFSLIAGLLQILPQLILEGTSQDYKEIDDLFFSVLRSSGFSIFGGSLNRIRNHLSEGHPTGHVKNIQEYNKLFPQIGTPEIAEDFQSDEAFAYTRIGGYNPVMIKRVNQLGDRFPVTEAQYQEVMGSDDSLAAAGEEGRLYLADYGILEGAVNGTFPKEQKYIYAPLALFAVPKGEDPGRLMRPVAIQCSQNPGDAPVLTPKSDKYAWLFAKTIVQIADANFHEAVTHLGRTHLFVGPFAIATRRQLLDNHPVSLLLRPHFEGTLAINNAAQSTLIAPNGGVDQLLSPTIDNARVLAAVGLQSYGFNEAMLPKQLQKRGVDDTTMLPVYPYRDDALLIWDAINQWVSDYLSIYYQTDEDVQNDTYLQAWAMEAGAYDGGRVPDFGEKDGRIQTLDYLIDAATLIIFTASAQHAAVNFPQKTMMSYAAAVPLAGYQPASLLKGEVSEQDYLNLLPPLEQAQRQLNLTYILGSIYYNRLGYYPDNHFQNPSVIAALQKFQKNLQEAETIIHQRNQTRPKYEYLLPSKIPQSINI